MSDSRSRQIVAAWTNSNTFELISTLVIVLNAIVLGALTYTQEILEAVPRTSNLLLLLGQMDTVCMLFFCVELLLRMYVAGWKFFREPWNIFDFTTVAVSLLAQHPIFSAIRVLRVIRLFRLMARLKTLRLISSVIMGSLAGCFSISLIMLVVMFVFALMGNELYGVASPELFGNLHRAMHTLFKVSSLYDYDSVVSVLADQHPSIYAYIIPYFLLMSYVFINFFSAIVIYLIYEVSFDELKSGRRNEAAEDAGVDVSSPEAGVLVTPAILHELAALTTEVRALREEVGRYRADVGR